MKIIKSASGQKIQISYQDWKKIGVRAGWQDESRMPKSVRPQLDLEEEVQKALPNLERQLESLKRLAPADSIDPRLVTNTLVKSLEQVLVATDESLSVYPNGKINGNVNKALKNFLTTHTGSGNMAKLKSITRQIVLIAKVLPVIDPRPIVPRNMRKLMVGLENLKHAPAPLPKGEILAKTLKLLAQMFPKKVYSPGTGASEEELEKIFRRYLATPPDSHPLEPQVQQFAAGILQEAINKSASTSSIMLKFASSGRTLPMTREQWMRIGAARGWIRRLAEETRPFKIAVGFDGTIAEHAEFPKIGEPVPDAFVWLRKFKKWGDKIFLYTMRSGDELEDAVEYCRKHGLEFDGVNEDPDQSEWTDSPKTYADVYIDDCGAGCPLLEEGRERPCVNWTEIGPMVARRRKHNK